METIFDIGQNNGEDTAFYLHRGYRVIAVEANRELTEFCNRRFEREIADGRLININKGISDSAGLKKFYINTRESQWSSFKKEVGGRFEMEYETVEVDCITFDSLIELYGTPYYCKIDIEQNDELCLDSLLRLPKSCCPQYLSVEADHTGLLDKMYAAGYRGFKMICQGYIYEQNTSDWTFGRGSSGNFGEDTPGAWEDIDAIKEQFLHPRPLCWYDFHAKMI